MHLSQQLVTTLERYLHGQIDQATVLTWLQRHVQAVSAAEATDPQIRDLSDIAWLTVDTADELGWSEAECRTQLQPQLNLRQVSAAG